MSTTKRKEELKDRFWEFVTQLSDKELLKLYKKTLKLYKKTDNTESGEYEIKLIIQAIQMIDKVDAVIKLELAKRGLIN